MKSDKLCECGQCGEYTKVNREGRVNRFLIGHNGGEKIDIEEEPKLCKCGCGDFTNKSREGIYRRFIRGHAWNGRKHSIESKKKISLSRIKDVKIIEKKLCECGCGEFTNIRKGAPSRFKRGHSAKGENNPMYGKTGKDSPSYGRRHSKETREKMVKSWETRPSATKETREKMAENLRKRWENDEEYRKKMLETHKNKIVSDETRKKLSELNKGKNNAMYGKKFSKESNQKRKETMMKRYGVSSVFLINGGSNRHSKSSQELFHQILSILPKELQDDTYFGVHNFEYPVEYEFGIRYFDFTIPSIKKCIEYNGEHVHAHLGMAPDQTGWQPYKPEMTAQESWDFDAKKNALMEAQGYEVLVVWSKEKNNLEKCLEFLGVSS